MNMRNSESVAEDDKLVGVTRTVVESFLSDLEKTDADPDIVTRLRVAILEEGNHSDKALSAVLFPDD